MRKIFAVVVLLLFSQQMLLAQELKCNVVINDQRIETSDRQIFKEMQNSIANFMNNRRWTTDTYTPEERINCNLVITLTESPSIGNYKATVQVQSSRPIYGSSYESLLLNYVDKDWEFDYALAQPMDFNENAFTSRLTSLLAFYAYIIIGYDADTFSKLGGKQFYAKAQIIANNAQQNQGRGWQAFDGTTNRYWLLENLQNQQLLPFREGIYNYHRLGLDNFIKDSNQARVHTLDLLNKIKGVLAQKPMTVLINNFFDSKSNELISIFTQATPQEKQQAFNLLSQLDPTKTEQYEKLLK